MKSFFGAIFALCLLAPAAGCNMVPGHDAPGGVAGVRAAIVAGNFGEAAKLAEEVVDDNPDDPNAHFELARANALAGNRGRALDALSEAVELGLANADTAFRDPAFTDMALMPRFAELARRASPATQISGDARAVGLGDDEEGADAMPALQSPVHSTEAGGNVSIARKADGGTVIRAGDVVLDTDF